jgi:mono/diheme cytochrome c family protein
MLVTPSAGSLQEKRLNERGKYFVEAVAICFECHSERDTAHAGRPIASNRKGAGRVLLDDKGIRLIAPNITPDRTTGIGAWTDSEIIRAIRVGVAPDGRQLNAEMPYQYYRSLDEEDLQAIVSYLRSIPAVFHDLPKNPPAVLPLREPAMDSLKLSQYSAQIRRGEFLARVAACETCHTPVHAGKFMLGLEFGGGTVFRLGDQVAASSNLTPDPSGISNYDEERFVQVMRTGRVGARALLSAMPWLFYRNMTTNDLKCIFAYLESVPPARHRVDNSEPISLCRRCGNRHGSGNLN